MRIILKNTHFAILSFLFVWFGAGSGNIFAQSTSGSYPQEGGFPSGGEIRQMLGDRPFVLEVVLPSVIGGILIFIPVLVLIAKTFTCQCDDCTGRSKTTADTKRFLYDDTDPY